VGFISPAPTGQSQLMALTSVGLALASNFEIGVPARQAKPAPDGKWWLYVIPYGEGYWSPGSMSGYDENRFIRGQSTRWLFVPESNWATGDELTDQATGAKYLLVVPDYANIGGRIRSSTNVYFGGIAIAEV
jgi:hypothetical protein